MPDLVQRQFTAQGSNHLWGADITYIPTWSGFLFLLAVVLDAWNRRIVGWSKASHLCTELVLDAFNMVLGPAPSPSGSNFLRYTSLALVGAAAKLACVLRWARSATATTTLCVRAVGRLELTDWRTSASALGHLGTVIEQSSKV